MAIHDTPQYASGMVPTPQGALPGRKPTVLIGFGGLNVLPHTGQCSDCTMYGPLGVVGCCMTRLQSGCVYPGTCLAWRWRGGDDHPRGGVDRGLGDAGTHFDVKCGGNGFLCGVLA